jgi:hypothetical protein
MLSRRQFVASPLAAGAVRTIVDAQVHLWKAESEDWKCVRGLNDEKTCSLN